MVGRKKSEKYTPSTGGCSLLKTEHERVALHACRTIYKTSEKAPKCFYVANRSHDLSILWIWSRWRARRRIIHLTSTHASFVRFLSRFFLAIISLSTTDLRTDGIFSFRALVSELRVSKFHCLIFFAREDSACSQPPDEWFWNLGKLRRCLNVRAIFDVIPKVGCLTISSKKQRRFSQVSQNQPHSHTS